MSKDLPALSAEHKMYALQGLSNCGLTFSDCVAFFEKEQQNNPDLVTLGRKAKHDFEQEGELEFSETPYVSETGDDEPGAYVMSWVWVNSD